MPIIISSITRVASTNRITNLLVSNNQNLLTNRSFLLNAKTAFRTTPASAASSCPSAWFDQLIDQPNRKHNEIEYHSQILSRNSSSGMDVTGPQPNRNCSNNNSNINYNMVSNAHRKIVPIDNDDELNGNDIMETRIKFRITENPMNAV